MKQIFRTCLLGIAAATAASVSQAAGFSVSVSSDGASADFAFEASDSVRRLYGAFGTADCGQSLGDWPESVLLATVPAGATALEGVALPVATLARNPAFRAFLEVPQTAADYVSDGLILLYDGVENAGWGVHDDSAVSWRNLVAADVNTGTDMPIGISGDSVGADAVSFAAQSRETSGALLSE